MEDFPHPLPPMMATFFFAPNGRSLVSLAKEEEEEEEEEEEFSDDDDDDDDDVEFRGVG